MNEIEGLAELKKSLGHLFTGSVRLPRTVWLLVIGRSINHVGAFTLSFLAVALTEEFGASISSAGVLVALFGAATLPSRLLGGWLADWLGHRTTLVSGLVLTAVAQLALATAPNFTVAAGAVILLGLAFEVYEPPSQALIAEAVPAPIRPAAYGRMSAGLSAAAVLSGLIAAAVGAVDVRLLFVIDAVSCLTCAALMRFTLPAKLTRADEEEAGAPDGSESKPSRSVVSPWRDRRLLALFTLGIVFASLYLQLNVTLPLTLEERGIPASRLGLLLALAAITIFLGQPLLTRGWVARADAYSAMSVGYLMLGIGLLANGFASSLWQFALATLLWSAGDLILLGRVYSLIADISPDNAKARYFSVYGLCWGVAAVIGPLAGTQLLAQLGPLWLWSVCAGACAFLAAAQIPMRRLVTGNTARSADKSSAPSASSV